MRHQQRDDRADVARAPLAKRPKPSSMKAPPNRIAHATLPPKSDQQREPEDADRDSVMKRSAPRAQRAGQYEQQSTDREDRLRQAVREREKEPESAHSEKPASCSAAGCREANRALAP